MSAKLELARRHNDPTPDEAWMSFETETPVAGAPGLQPSAPNAASPAQTTGSGTRQAAESNLEAVPGPSDSLDSLTARVRASSAAAATAATTTVSEVIRKPWYQHPLFRPMVALAAIAMLVIAATWMIVRVPRSEGPAAKAASGTKASGAAGAQSTAVFTSEPAGATVTVDAVVRGVTPLKLQLPVGDHVADFTYNDVTRSISFDLAAATTATQHVAFAGGDLTPSGRLDIASDPSGAQVTIDGVKSGRTPLALASIGVGRHAVVISSGDTTVQRTVNVTRGATASVVATLGTAAPPSSAGGWITFQTPADLQVREKGEIIGTTSASRLMLPAGKHDLELISDALEFRTSLSVQVKPGATTPAPVSLPNGSLSVNASPWAEVSVDGRSLGTTPLANVAVPIGTHEIVWRHPQLGERRRTITLSAKTPVRVGMDFSR